MRRNRNRCHVPACDSALPHSFYSVLFRFLPLFHHFFPHLVLLIPLTFFLCASIPYFLSLFISFYRSMSLISLFPFLSESFLFYLPFVHSFSAISSKIHIFPPFLTYCNFAIMTEQISSRDILLHRSIPNFPCALSDIRKVLFE